MPYFEGTNYCSKHRHNLKSCTLSKNKLTTTHRLFSALCLYNSWRWARTLAFPQTSSLNTFPNTYPVIGGGVHCDEYGRKRGAHRSERRERLHAPTAGEDAGAHWSAPGGVEDNYLSCLFCSRLLLDVCRCACGRQITFFLPLFDVGTLECSVGDFEIWSLSDCVFLINMIVTIILIKWYYNNKLGII